VKRFDYVREGEEVVEVPAGRFLTVRMRQLDGEDERTTRLWLAPALGGWPVRVTHEEGEDSPTLRLELESWQSPLTSARPAPASTSAAPSTTLGRAPVVR